MATKLGRYVSIGGFASGSRAAGATVKLNNGVNDSVTIYGSTVSLQDYHTSLKQDGVWGQDFELAGLRITAEGTFQGSGSFPLQADDLYRLATCNLVMKKDGFTELLGPLSAFLNQPVVEHMAVSDTTTSTVLQRRAAYMLLDRPVMLAQPWPISYNADWQLLAIELQGGTYAAAVTLKTEFYGRLVQISKGGA